MNLQTYRGSCHCQLIQFTVSAPPTLEVDRCNCSICSKSGYLHLIVPQSKFELSQGKEYLQTYQFGSMIARHTFCKVCGIKPFYIPRSNPDGISINVNCLDPKPEDIIIHDFDGQNWAKNAHKLSHKSKD
jgi:hypothetical protein